MDQARYEQGLQAYESGDMRVAAREFLAAADGTDDAAAYHHAGNALMRLRRYDDAVTVYGKALASEGYERRTAVLANLGAAHAAAGHFDDAVAAYRAVLADPAYGPTYKARQGMAGAYYKMGQLAEAAEEYRRAALDDSNPDPGKALNNLGMCFMALGRPQDAVEAYRAAVDMEGYAGRGKAAANLGLAYVALGVHEQAVRAFARARDSFGYTFPDATQKAFDASLAALSADHEVIEGWSTGEMPPVTADSRPGGPAVAAGSSAAPTRAATERDEDEEAEESAFFTRTDDDMRVADKEARRRERVERRTSRSVWVTIATWVTVVVVVAGALVFAWVSGLGYPTQDMTVRRMLEAHSNGEPVDPYWVAVPTADVEKEMSKLPPGFASFEIGAVEGSPSTSKVDVTITLETGAPLDYQILLAREGVGWKVNGVTNDWRSTGGGS